MSNSGKAFCSASHPSVAYWLPCEPSEYSTLAVSHSTRRHLEMGYRLRVGFHPRRSARRVSRSRIRAIHAVGGHRLLARRNSLGSIFRLLPSRQLWRGLGWIVQRWGIWIAGLLFAPSDRQSLDAHWLSHGIRLGRDILLRCRRQWAGVTRAPSEFEFVWSGLAVRRHCRP